MTKVMTVIMSWEITRFARLPCRQDFGWFILIRFVVVLLNFLLATSTRTDATFVVRVLIIAGSDQILWVDSFMNTLMTENLLEALLLCFALGNPLTLRPSLQALTLLSNTVVSHSPRLPFEEFHQVMLRLLFRVTCRSAIVQCRSDHLPTGKFLNLILHHL